MAYQFRFQKLLELKENEKDQSLSSISNQFLNLKTLLKNYMRI